MKRPYSNSEARRLGVWPKCGHPRTPDNTHGFSSHRVGGQCRTCHRAALARFMSSPGAAVRVSEYQRRHYNTTKREKRSGWSQEAYETAYRLQGGECAICRVACDALVGDHCHAAKRPRALLCTSCNWLLGHARDNAVVLRAAADYVEKYRQAA